MNDMRIGGSAGASPSHGFDATFLQNLLHSCLCVMLLACSARAADVVFRDDFDGQLAAGWEFVREDPSAYSLSDRPGFLRIESQRGAFGDGQPVQNLLLRERSGDFILETRVEFDPQRALEFAGLIVYLDDDNSVALGLAYAAGERGVFRGIVMVSLEDGASGGQRPGAFYDEDSVENPNVVYLRLLRSGDQFVAGYSPDGVTYSDIGSLTLSLPSAVRVGVGATNGDFEDCGSDCDVQVPADFDFFQISTFGDGDDPTDGIVLESLTIEGDDEVLGGTTTSYTAVAEFSDGSTQDVSEDAEWTSAPPTAGSIEGGEFEGADVDEPTQVTIVATYTHLTSGGAVTRTDSLLVLVSPPPSAGPRGCGVGMLGLLALLTPIWLSRLIGPLRARS